MVIKHNAQLYLYSNSTLLQAYNIYLFQLHVLFQHLNGSRYYPAIYAEKL